MIACNIKNEGSSDTKCCKEIQNRIQNEPYARSAIEPSSVILKARCWEPPGHYLCTPEPGTPGCVISIEKGVKPANATSAERRLERK